MRILVTGGSGFIGSCLVDRLRNDGNEIFVADLNGSGENIINIDLTNIEALSNLPKVDEVWHLAANPEVREGNSDIHNKQNYVATRNILEWAKKNGVKKIYFTSTSTVYGEAEKIPTPEIADLRPISSYGESKVKAEQAIIDSGIDYVIFRFANVVGRQSGHGVIFDFVNKLRVDGTKLKILGNGKQIKSYVDIDDCLDAMVFCRKFSKEILNIGTDDWIDVDTIAGVVSNKMGISPEYSYTGGNRGWKGDVPKMLLSIEKIKALGWKPKLTSKQAIERTVEGILQK
jgi:UDP-glucose 4-epimerase